LQKKNTKYLELTVARFSTKFVGMLTTVVIDGMPFYLYLISNNDVESPSATRPSKYLGVYLDRSPMGEFADPCWDRWVELRFHIKSSQDSSADIVRSIGQKKLTKESQRAGDAEMTTVVILGSN
jgi:hypothetical protein